MGLTRINTAIAALTAAGLRAGRGFPGGTQPALTAPAVTVGIHRASGESVTLAVTVFVTPEMGGSTCEDCAIKAVAALEGLGAVCTQEACEYDRTWGLLSVRVLAAWEPEPEDTETESEESTGPEPLGCTVLVSGTALSYVTGVTIQHQEELNPIEAVGEGTVAMRREKSRWDITLEELLPLNHVPQAITNSSFTLQVKRSGATERFLSCRWISLRREDTPQGVNQVRVARTWEDRVIISG